MESTVSEFAVAPMVEFPKQRLLLRTRALSLKKHGLIFGLAALLSPSPLADVARSRRRECFGHMRSDGWVVGGASDARSRRLFVRLSGRWRMRPFRMPRVSPRLC
eukprot:5930140-Pyramimonas_sp.AAC.1